MKRCRHCGYKNYALTEVCEDCGAPLENTVDVSDDDTLPSRELPSMQSLAEKGHWFPGRGPGNQ